MTASNVALVTGANRGIGLEVTRQLAARGLTVWMGMRDPDRGAEAEAALRAEKLDVRVLALDVTSDGSVREAAARVAEDSGLDILVNNAGVALEGRAAPSEVSLELMRNTYEVNVFGAVRVTQAFLPVLRRSAAPRIVMVSSDMGSHTHRTDPDSPNRAFNPIAYISSKAALNAVTIAFANELGGTPFKVNAANPGFTATDLNGHTGRLTVQEGARSIVELATLSDLGPTGTFLGPDGAEPW